MAKAQTLDLENLSSSSCSHQKGLVTGAQQAQHGVSAFLFFMQSSCSGGQTWVLPFTQKLDTMPLLSTVKGTVQVGLSG